MTDQEAELIPPLPAPTTPRWLLFGTLLAVPLAVALTLIATLSRAPKVGLTASTNGGCDHTADANGYSSCPHGVNANGGCTMNAAGTDRQKLPAQSLPEKRLTWVLPQGWTAETSAIGMRFATLKPANQGKVEVSVIALPGSAGGELANLNRWRGQIDLPPIDEKDLISQRIQVKAKPGLVSVFDLSNPKAPAGHLVVGVFDAGSQTWFVKMVGDHEPVAKARSAFLRLLESLEIR